MDLRHFDLIELYMLLHGKFMFLGYLFTSLDFLKYIEEKINIMAYVKTFIFMGLVIFNKLLQHFYPNFHVQNERVIYKS